MSTDQAANALEAKVTGTGQERSTSDPTTATKPSRQRFKPQLSCTLCRSRKLKCDRNQPCENCVKRDLASSCTFIHAGIIRDKAAVQKPGSSVNPRDVQGRIKHLEDLVVSLMQRSAMDSESIAASESVSPESAAPQSTISDASESLGRFSIDDNNQPNYIGGSHWAAILESIAGLKDSLDEGWSKDDEKQWKALPKATGPALLVGSIRSATKAEILAAMPTRAIVDALITEIIDLDAVVCIAIHKPTFKKEYERFWADPQGCPVMWIGLLYGMMCLSTNMRILTGNNSTSLLSGTALRDPHDMLALFHEKIVQCLVLGNYAEPTKYTVETLVVYTLIEYFRNSEIQVAGWMIVGLVVRAAMRLGYHRDASHYPNISILQGEMQRRLWACVCHLDLLTSSQVGLPRMVKEVEFDTKCPTNLLDEDLDENSKTLPPSRPQDELTLTGFILLKHGLMMVSGKISDQANSTQPISYDEILQLDTELEEIRLEMPESLIVRKPEDRSSGTADMIVRKFSTNLIYHKSRCVLHRKFLIPPTSSTVSPYPYSVKRCVDSAMEILQSQAFMWRETRPGQVLHNRRWEMETLMTQDFLLAAMLLCLYLSQRTDDTFFEQANQGEYAITWTREQTLEALDGSFQIWNSKKCGSKDALKAAKALKAMMLKIKRNTTTTNMRTESPSSQSSYGPGQQVNQAQYTPDGSIQTTSSSPWVTGSFSSDQYISGADLNTASYPVIDEMIDAPMDFNWEIWDSQFQNINSNGALPVEAWAMDSSSFPTFPDLNAATYVP